MIAFAIIVARLVPRIWRGSAPATLKELERSSQRRSFAIAKLALDMNRWPSMTLGEVKGFQHRVLEQIASYVRDLRGDARGRTIFANLLCEKDASLLEVVARSDDRPLYGVVPKSTSIGWHAIQSGEKEWCGDLYVDFPSAPPGKRYASVLAIPVPDHLGNVVGVVTIDSRERHHFDAIHEDVVLHVMPLVAMLGWTLARTAWFDLNRKEAP